MRTRLARRTLAARGESLRLILTWRGQWGWRWLERSCCQDRTRGSRPPPSTTGLAAPALKLARDIEDREVEAVVSNTLAAVSMRLGDARAALRHGRRALRLAHQTGSRNPEVVALIGLAAAHRHLGQFEPARTAAERALLQARQTGYRILEGMALTTLADVALATGDGPQAATRAHQALDIQRATGHRLGQARALLALGHALHRTGDPAAVASWQEALALFVSVGNPEADEARACLSTSIGVRGRRAEA